MLKLLISILCLALSYAHSSILISGFDPFDRQSGNNSMAIGKAAAQKLQKLRPNSEIKYCQLRTVYDKSAETLKDCIASMKKAPSLVLSLGEANCNQLKIETRAFNYDRDFSHDNDGVHRRGQRIEPKGPRSLGMNYPIQKLWCSLKEGDKNFTVISRNAGSFVCNNLAYHVLHDLPQTPFIFAHVPKDNCKHRPKYNYTRSLDIIVAIALKALDLGPISGKMPATKASTRARLKSENGCEGDFFGQLLRAY